MSITATRKSIASLINVLRWSHSSYSNRSSMLRCFYLPRGTSLSGSPEAIDYIRHCPQEILIRRDVSIPVKATLAPFFQGIHLKTGMKMHQDTNSAESAAVHSFHSAFGLFLPPLDISILVLNELSAYFASLRMSDTNIPPLALLKSLLVPDSLLCRYVFGNTINWTTKKYAIRMN